MVKFLLHRPIAVVMAFLAAVIIGAVTYLTLPVSLLPSIDIPQITVQITGEGLGARELENTVTAPVRRQLLQVGGLSDIRSTTRDGIGMIHIQFDYGVNTNLAFIEVNEKIDAAMGSLPRGTARPKAVKASATDIPVLYLSLTLDNDDPDRFLALAEVADNVIRRRIEQLPQVAMADVTGLPRRQIRVTPDRSVMASLGITIADIERAIAASNTEPGSMTVRDGYYEYAINVANHLTTAADLEQVRIEKGGRIMQLGDFCRVESVADSPDGYAFCNGRRAINLAIIKQDTESMSSLKKALAETTEYFGKEYPEVIFTQSRNQTELLDYTISNLVQNLVIGFVLVFLLTAVFMGSWRNSLVIGISIMVSVVTTFLLFYLFGVSLNIISLAGLILAVGMMIDNSVIVTENIVQYRQRGYPLLNACDAGATEMITPMLSSTLTTVAVFVPMIFMSGIAGAIFTDQAFSITAGLAVSYITGIMLLPVMYMLINSTGAARRGSAPGVSRRVERTNEWMDRTYTRIIDFCFRNKAMCVTLTALTIPMCVVLFEDIPVERMPGIDRTETIARIDWNENINLDENARRTEEVVGRIDTSLIVTHSAEVGIQDYLLNSGQALSPTESEVYLCARTPAQLSGAVSQLEAAIAGEYPDATVQFLPAANIFDKIFTSDEAELEARLHSPDITVGGLLEIERQLTDNPTPTRDRLRLTVDRERLMLYNIGSDEVSRALVTAFKGSNAGTLRSYQLYMPIVIASDGRTVEQVLAGTMVKGVPLSYVVKVAHDKDLRNITAATDGEYVPIAYDNVDSPEATMQAVREVVDRADGWNVDFVGTIFANARMMREFVVILMVSLLMMYFILCAQFGSFVQPLIVLLEIPVDIAIALISLWIFGHTLNLMSAIGIIVTCGIVVNDSILKLDAINELRAQGMPLVEAIHTAGKRRLRPIIMTSLTTILAMVPILFTHDMGSELQRPLAIALISSMLIGTVVSVFAIPVFYWLIYRKNEKTAA